MRNISIITENANTTAFETKKIFNGIDNHYGTITRLFMHKDIINTDIENSDMIISIRPTSIFDFKIAKFAKINRKLFGIVLDDDLLGLPDNYGTSGSGMWSERLKMLKCILHYTDVIITGNVLIGEKYGKLSKTGRYIICNTAVSHDIIYKKKCLHGINDKIKILYYASDGSVQMFNRLIVPILEQLCNCYKDKISLTLMTLRPDLSAFEGKMDIRYVDHINCKKFREYLRSGQFDIGIAPLTEQVFNQCKYFNKYIEYSIAGIAGIYSNCKPYTYVIKDSINGILCDDSSESWYNAFCRMIEDEKFRLDCIKNAQTQLINDFSLDKIVDMMINQFPELITFSSPKYKFQCNVKMINFYQLIFLLREHLHFLLWHLKDEGLLRLLNRILRYVQKILKEHDEIKHLRDRNYE